MIHFSERLRLADDFTNECGAENIKAFVTSLLWLYQKGFIDERAIHKHYGTEGKNDLL